LPPLNQHAQVPGDQTPCRDASGVGRTFSGQRRFPVQPAKHIVLRDLNALASGSLGRPHGLRYLSIPQQT
jgi:hypothetical protein